MSDRDASAFDEIKGIIERVDEICREAERMRDHADHAMRQRPVWPEPARSERVTETPATPRDDSDHDNRES